MPQKPRKRTRSTAPRKREVDELWRRVDGALERLVYIVNGVESLSVGITLTVQGTVSTGMLCSAKEWFAEYARQMEATNNPIGEQLARSTRKIYEATYVDKRKADDEPFTAIHLKNARIWHGLQIFPDGGLLWRGRLEHVSGFALGTVERSVG